MDTRLLPCMPPSPCPLPPLTHEADVDVPTNTHAIRQLSRDPADQLQEQRLLDVLVAVDLGGDGPRQLREDLSVVVGVGVGVGGGGGGGGGGGFVFLVARFAIGVVPTAFVVSLLSCAVQYKKTESAAERKSAYFLVARVGLKLYNSTRVDRRGKTGIRPSRDKNAFQGKNGSGEGGGEPTALWAPELSYDNYYQKRREKEGRTPYKGWREKKKKKRRQMLLTCLPLLLLLPRQRLLSSLVYLVV